MMSSYQKLKNERDLLKEQLLEVVKNPNGVLATTIKIKCKVSNGIERVLWVGNTEDIHKVVVNPEDWL